MVGGCHPQRISVDACAPTDFCRWLRPYAFREVVAPLRIFVDGCVPISPINDALVMGTFLLPHVLSLASNINSIVQVLVARPTQCSTALSHAPLIALRSPAAAQ